jgi:hypothetical protein
MTGRGRLVLIVVGVVLIASFFFGAPVVMRAISNAKAVGDNPKEDAGGVVRVSPPALLLSVNRALSEAGKAPIDLDTMTLARSLRSEHGSESAQVRAWVAWVVRNSAAKSRVSIFDRLTKSRNAATSGLFARQRVDARFAATNQAPRLEDIEIATQVLKAPASADPTRGASNFFSPKAQDALFARAQAGDPAVAGRITRDAAAQRLRWLESGLVSRGAPPGASTRDVEFFGPSDARFA